jgi:AraC-like DNA-binding protein
MIREFDGNGIGREMKLRAILVNMIVELLRWEEKSGKSLMNTELAIDWRRLERALQFLHEHFHETVYAREVASHAGISESRLKQLFHDTLGMPWSQYMQIYRIHRALDQLGACGKNISETALAVGFESLSHFNSTFRSLMGVSPRDYANKAPHRLDCPSALHAGL